MPHVEYKTNVDISIDQFLELLDSSTLATRRPIHNLTCIKGMLDNSNLTISAWHDDKLIGIARSMTDFHYACYLSDLAVDKDYQNKGVGITLQQLTRDRIQPTCKLILISAPDANEYYPAIGYENSDRCWVLPAGKKLT